MNSSHVKENKLKHVLQPETENMLKHVPEEEVGGVNPFQRVLAIRPDFNRGEEMKECSDCVRGFW